MAQHKSSKKRIKQTTKKTLRNKATVSRMRTMVKKFLTKIDESVDVKTLEADFKDLQSMISKVVKKGIIKKNAGSRYVSRLANKLLHPVEKKVEEPKKKKVSTKSKAKKTKGTVVKKDKSEIKEEKKEIKATE